MATFGIRDLPDNQELDRQAMATVHGGLLSGYSGGPQASVTPADADAGTASKVKHQDFHFVHHSDKPSPAIGW